MAAELAALVATEAALAAEKAELEAAALAAGEPPLAGSPEGTILGAVGAVGALSGGVLALVAGGITCREAVAPLLARGTPVAMLAVSSLHTEEGTGCGRADVESWGMNGWQGRSFPSSDLVSDFPTTPRLEWPRGSHMA